MIIYLVNSTLCLLFLYLLYRFFLQTERMHLFNRFYILFALILGLLLPTQDFFQSTPALRMQPEEKITGIEAQTFVDIKRAPMMLLSKTIFPVGDKLDRAAIVENEGGVATSSVNPSSLFATIFFGLYTLITLIMLAKYAWGIFHILRKARSNKQIPIRGTPAHLVLLEEEVSPHSFMDYIFVSKAEYEQGHINENIINHELAHLKGYHTLDLMLVELIKALCWWNPGVHLFRRALQINHEFWADEQVIRQTDDISGYQQQLLKVAVTDKQVLLASNLNFFLTKQRMFMMTKEISRIRNSMKKVLLAPLLPLLVLIYGLHTFNIKNLNHSTANIELTADTLSISPELQVIKWKDPSGNYYTGSENIFDNRTGILRTEKIYDDGRIIEYRNYNELGHAGIRSFTTYDGDIPITRHHLFSDHLFGKQTFPHPDNNYIGTQKNYDKQGNLIYELNYKGNIYNRHGLETAYDENGNILKQKRYENGKLIETIK